MSQLKLLGLLGYRLLSVQSGISRPEGPGRAGEHANFSILQHTVVSLQPVGVSSLLTLFSFAQLLPVDTLAKKAI